MINCCHAKIRSVLDCKRICTPPVSAGAPQTPRLGLGDGRESPTNFSFRVGLLAELAVHVMHALGIGMVRTGWHLVRALLRFVVAITLTARVGGRTCRCSWRAAAVHAPWRGARTRAVVRLAGSVSELQARVEPRAIHIVTTLDLPLVWHARMIEVREGGVRHDANLPRLRVRRVDLELQ